MNEKYYPVELVEALEEYFEKHPKQKNIEIFSGKTSSLLGSLPDEIRKRTKIGIDYEKSLYKMAFEDLIRGRKQLLV